MGEGTAGQQLGPRPWQGAGPVWAAEDGGPGQSGRCCSHVTHRGASLLCLLLDVRWGHFLRPATFRLLLVSRG